MKIKKHYEKNILLFDFFFYNNNNIFIILHNIYLDMKIIFILKKLNDLYWSNKPLKIRAWEDKPFIQIFNTFEYFIFGLTSPIAQG